MLQGSLKLLDRPLYLLTSRTLPDQKVNNYGGYIVLFIGDSVCVCVCVCMWVSVWVGE